MELWDLLAQPLGRQLAWTLAHFAWQGALVAAVLWLVHRLTAVRQANMRYALSMVALLAMAACPIFTFALLIRHVPPSIPKVAVVPYNSIASRPGNAILPAQAAAPVSPAASMQQPLGTAIELRQDTDGLWWQPFVLTGWLLGVSVLSLRMLAGWVGVWNLRRGRQPLPERLAAYVAPCAGRLGLRFIPQVFVSERVRGAIALGLWRPVILLPASWLLELTPEVLEAVVLHELAHIRRWDLWANLFQRVVETLLFYHPAVWWLSARIRLEREMCCDELAVAATGRRIAYLGALEWVARQQQAPGSTLLGMAIGGRTMTLLTRVRYLVGAEPRQAKGRWWPVGLFAILVPLAVWMAGRCIAGLPSVEQRIARDTAVLRQHRVSDETERCCEAIRDLVEIGPPAVPVLVEELERTENPSTVSAMGFALRAIGDPRAVPALIRTIPRTLGLQGAGDYGLRVESRSLQRFMQRHDLDMDPRGQLFTFCSPAREVFGALNHITGQQFNEEELNSVFPCGRAEQQALQQRLYHQTAQRWAEWWEANWAKFTDDPACAKVGLASLPDEIVAKLPQSGAGQEIPVHGQFDGGVCGMTVGSPQSAAEACFFDLDTGRQMKWPSTLPASMKLDADDPMLAKWAADEGIDLMGVERPLPGSSRAVYALRIFDAKAWRIEGGRKAIERQLQERKPLSPGEPVGDLLIPDGKPAGDASSNTFLLITREGATAVLSLSQVGVPSRTSSGPKRVPWRDGAEFDYAVLCEKQAQQGSAGNSQATMCSVSVTSDSGLIGTVVYPVRIEWVGGEEGSLLERRVAVEISEARLSDVVRLLRALLDVPVVLEEPLAGSPADLESPITLRAHAIRLEDFLAALLEPFGLRYELGNDGLVLWHPQYAARKTVRYPIADILAPPEPDSGAAINAEEAATLTRLITTTVAPTSWSTADGRRLIEATDSGELIVTQTREVQQEIREFLAQLRSQQGAPRAKQVPLDFDHAPLGKILDWLYEEHQVNVQVDHQALKEAGCDLNTPVTVHSGNLPLEPALEAMLEPLELDCRLENGIVRIGRIQMLAVNYNVADLLSTAPKGQPANPGRFSFNTLIERIKTDVLPTSWEGRGGGASIAPFETNLSLVVSQTRKGHRQLAELLDKLRQEEDVRLKQESREPDPERVADSSLRSE